MQMGSFKVRDQVRMSAESFSQSCKTEYNLKGLEEDTVSKERRGEMRRN